MSNSNQQYGNSSDIITTAQKIENKIQQLEEERSDLVDAGIEKANSLSNYEKELAITILRLKNGDIAEFEGQSCTKLPANLIEKVAKGIIYQKSFDKEAAESVYKSKIVIMEAIRAEINAYQTINKYIE